MPINAIQNQTINYNAQENKNVITPKVIPTIDNKDSVSFSGNNENNKDTKSIKSLLMGGGVLTGLLGIGISIFDKSHKINKAIPIILDLVGSLMIIPTFFMNDKNK